LNIICNGSEASKEEQKGLGRWDIREKGKKKGFSGGFRLVKLWATGCPLLARRSKLFVSCKSL